MTRRTYVLLGLVCILLIGCAPLAHHSGRVDAKRDLAKGILANERFGLPVLGLDEHAHIVLSQEEYSKFLQERFGIELRSVAGCVVNGRIYAHADGYNEIMDAEIERRFGTNFWSRAWEDAYKLSAAKHAPRQGGLWFGSLWSMPVGLHPFVTDVARIM